MVQHLWHCNECTSTALVFIVERPHASLNEVIPVRQNTDDMMPQPMFPITSNTGTMIACQDCNCVDLTPYRDDALVYPAGQGQ